MSSLNACLLVLLTVAGTSLYILFTTDLHWEMYSLKSIIECKEIFNMNANTLYFFRLCNFSLMMYTVYSQLSDKEGIHLKIVQHGKLRTERIIGAQRFTMFTVWSWNLQLVYFGLSSYLTFIDGKNERLIRLCVVLYELSFSLAFLVTVVTTFVLLPTQIQRRIPLDNFFRPMCTFFSLQFHFPVSFVCSVVLFFLSSFIFIYLVSSMNIFLHSSTYAQFECVKCRSRDDF